MRRALTLGALVVVGLAAGGAEGDVIVDPDGVGATDVWYVDTGTIPGTLTPFASVADGFFQSGLPGFVQVGLTGAGGLRIVDDGIGSGRFVFGQDPFPIPYPELSASLDVVGDTRLTAREFFGDEYVPVAVRVRDGAELAITDLRELFWGRRAGFTLDIENGARVSRDENAADTFLGYDYRDSRPLSGTISEPVRVTVTGPGSALVFPNNGVSRVLVGGELNARIGVGDGGRLEGNSALLVGVNGNFGTWNGVPEVDVAGEGSAFGGWDLFVGSTRPGIVRVRDGANLVARRVNVNNEVRAVGDGVSVLEIGGPNTLATVRFLTLDPFNSSTVPSLVTVSDGASLVFSSGASLTINGRSVPAEVEVTGVGSRLGSSATIVPRVFMNGAHAVFRVGPYAAVEARSLSASLDPTILVTLTEDDEGGPARFSCLESFAFDGTLVVEFDGALPGAGAVFDLFDAPAISGAFDTAMLPPLDGGLAWDTSSLLVDGTVRVVGVSCNGADLVAPFGQLTFADIAAFLAAFNDSDAAADLAEPFGALTFGDITAFLGAFAAGCP